MCSSAASFVIKGRESRLYIRAHTHAHIYVHISREVAGSHYVSQRTAESSRFLLRVSRFPPAIVSLPLRGRPSRFLLQRAATWPIPFSASERVRARERCCYTLQGTGENTGLLRSRYEIIPGGLASRKFITINRTHTLRWTPGTAASPWRIACTKFCITHSPRSRFPLSRAHQAVSSHTDEKDDGIIFFYVCVCTHTRDEKTCHDETFLDKVHFDSSHSEIIQPTITLSKEIQTKERDREK